MCMKKEIEDLIRAKFLAEYVGKPVSGESGWFYKDFQVSFYDTYVDGTDEYDEGYDIPTYSITATLETETKKGKKTKTQVMSL